jgi:hypothetical protein
MMNSFTTLQAQVRYQQRELIAEADRARLVRAVRSGRGTKARRPSHGRWRD